MLTRKQFLLLQFIDQRLKETGVSPSFDEMKDALSLKSKSGIHRLIKGLEERGFLRRLPHRARALEILRLPDAMAAADAAENDDEAATQAGEPAAGLAEAATAAPPPSAAPLSGAPPRPGFSPKVIEGDFAPCLPSAQVDEAAAAEAVSLPLVGKIAAGNPIDAITDPSEFISVPAAMVRGGEHFALTVEGDSMIEAGILDGDIALCRRCDTADNGIIVVALVDGEEATLKRLRRKGASIALEPANARYETRIFGPDRVSIQGRLVGLMRLY